jgi:Domain of unknown function (DUF4157)
VNRSTARLARSNAGTAEVPSNLLQRKCACESPEWVGKKCDDCEDKEPPLARYADTTHDFSRIPVRHAISHPGDALEQEADRAAKRVMRMPGSGLSESHRKPRVSEEPPPIGLTGRGVPLPDAARSYMECRFGVDFSGVRIHTDAAADRSAESVQARAYTVRNHIVFRKGAFDPLSSKGRQLIAHELAHTVQQTARPADVAVPGLTRSPPLVAREPQDERPSREWIDGQIALIQQQLSMPVVLPQVRVPLQLRLMELQRQRVTAIPGKAVTAPSKKGVRRRCPLFGNVRPDSAYIDAKLMEIELAKSQLVTDVMNPASSTTYEQIVPKLYELRHLKIQLLNCAVNLALPTAAQAQEALNQEARALGEEQYKRKQQDWDDLSRKQMVAFDIIEQVGVLKRVSLGSFRPEKRRLRHPMISTIEGELYENPRAREIYQKVLWDLEHNQPEEKSTFKKIMDVACENLAPCIDNLEQYRACIDSGKSVDDCRAQGLFRIGLNTYQLMQAVPKSPAPRDPGGGFGGPGTLQPSPATGTGQGTIALRRAEPFRPNVPVVPIPAPTEKPKTPPKPVDEPPVAPTPAQTPTTTPTPKSTTSTPPTPAPKPKTGSDTDVDIVPLPRPDPRQRQKCVGPTGLSTQDPIPITWFKPRDDYLYPAKIAVERNGNRGVIERDDPRTKLPDGTPVGVREEFWPRLNKLVQLLPQKRTGKQREFKLLLIEWGFDWGTMQPDHVLDIDWSGPDAFGNLWPLETSTNLSAGASQNVNQEVSFCLTPDGPRYDGRRISSVKRMLSGRYFVITRVAYHS